ncbi:unnamed protein product, partial [Ceratitis capitata]
LGGEAPAGNAAWGASFPSERALPREALAVCTPPALSPLQGRLAPRSEGKARASWLRTQSGTTHGSHTPAACSFRARTLEAGQGLGRLAQHRAASRRGSVLSRLGAELELRRCGSSLGPSSTGLQAPAGSQPLLSRVPGMAPNLDQSNCRSSLIMGWFPCAAAVLGSQNAREAAQHIHLPLGGGQLQGRPGLAGAFWAQTEQHSGCGAASPSQGHRDPDSSVRRLVWAGKHQLGMQPGALPFPRKELSPREALAVCTPPALSPLQGRLAPRSEGKARAELRHQSGTLTAPTLPQLLLPGANARSWAGLGEARPHRAASRPGLCAIAPGRRAGAPPVWKLTRSFPVQACQAPAQPASSLPRSGIGLQTWDQSKCPELTDHGLVPLRCGCAREPKRPGEARTAHPPASRRRTAPGKARLAGAFWAQTEQHSGCGAASPSQGHRDHVPPWALSLGGEAPAWECSLGRFLSLGKSSPRGGFGSVHTPSLSPLQGRLAPRSEGKARAELRHQSGTTHGSHTHPACSFPGANARSWAGPGEARPAQSSLSPRALCYRAWAQSWSSAGVEAHSVLPVQACKHPRQPASLSRVSGIGLQTWDQSNARSSLIMGWFPCAAAVLGSPNAQGKPHSTSTCL